MFEAEAGGIHLWLLPQRAACLVEPRWLLVADAHVGKAASFRSLGVPVPRGTTTQTLERLSAAIGECAATRVVFLGDLLHSAAAHAARTLDALARWRERHRSVEMMLVRGNHDDRAGDPPRSLGIEAVDEPLHIGGLALCHHPRPMAGAYVLAGHLHPCVAVGARANDRLRLPCFHFGNRVGVLPAFGEFTGMHTIAPAPGDRVYLVADGSVRALPAAPRPTLAAP
jgi:uncharacterized protein